MPLAEAKANASLMGQVEERQRQSSFLTPELTLICSSARKANQKKKRFDEATWLVSVSLAVVVPGQPWKEVLLRAAVHLTLHT